MRLHLRILLSRFLGSKLKHEKKRASQSILNTLKVKTLITLKLWFLFVSFSQTISWIYFPKDGDTNTVITSNVDGENFTTRTKIFFIHGIIRNNYDEQFALVLSERILQPVTIIHNGSSCADNVTKCRKIGDFTKAFFNRFGNRLTGRGNEPIIKSAREQLQVALDDRHLSRIVLITHSEGGLIALAAVEDLVEQKHPHLDRLTVILMGTPAHYPKIVELKRSVGEVIVLSNPGDPITCFQKDIWRWSNWFGSTPIVKQCFATGDPRQHLDASYLDRLQTYLLQRLKDRHLNSSLDG